MAVDVEVITIGGGEYIVNVFNAVAAWTDAGGYRGMLQVVLVMAFAMSLLVLSFNSDWRAWLKWFAQSTLMYLCLMAPPANVVVVDRVNPDLKAAAISDVPLGLALIASFTSQMGDYLVRASEVVFSMPEDLNYSRNGMIYGSRLLEATQGLSINNPYFATNLDEYYRQCTFYDLQLGLESWKEISEATDVWEAVGPGAKARSMPFIQMDSATPTTDIVTCQEGYTKLDAAWKGVTDKLESRISKRFYPELTAGAAKAKLMADLPVAYQYLVGVSKDASELMKQTLAVNAMQQAIATQAGATGLSTDAYAQTRAQIQTRKTYEAVSHNAKEWVPILNIVLTVVFYALFPILFPLFLMPTTGPTTLKGYVMGFFYLAAWGPIYVILNMIVTLREHSALGGTENPLSILTFNDISQVNANTSVLAGYLMASIPFIAAGMAKGAMAIASHSTSFLAPSQNAAEEAGREASTGNIAFGNTSLDNLSFNNRQSGAWSMAGSLQDGSSTITTTAPFGTTQTQYQDGSTRTEAPISKLPFTPQISSAHDLAVSKAASHFVQAGDRKSETVRQGVATSLSQLADVRNGFENRSSTSLTVGHGENASLKNGFSAIDNLSESLQRAHGLSQTEADNWASAAALGLDGRLTLFDTKGLPLVGKLMEKVGARGTMGASGSLTREWRDTEGKARSLDLRAVDDTVQSWKRDSSWDNQEEGFRRAVSESSNASFSSSSRGLSATLTETAEAAKEASRSYEVADRLEQSWKLGRTEGVSSSINYTDDFLQFADRAMADRAYAAMWSGSDFNVRRPADWTTSDPRIVAQREQLVEKYMSDKVEALQREGEQYMKQPADTVRGPDIRDEAGVRALGASNLASIGSVGGGGEDGAAIRNRAEGVFDEVGNQHANQGRSVDAAISAGQQRRGLVTSRADGDVEDQVDRELPHAQTWWSPVTRRPPVK